MIFNCYFSIALSKLTPVILSLSKERGLSQDDLRRKLPYFDKLSMTIEVERV